MAENSNIEWTHHTFNPWRGCTKVSTGCKFCYAETMSGRNPSVLGVWGKRGSRPIAVESYWKHPIKWNRDAMEAGERRRVFCASLADVFEGRDTMPESAHEAVERTRVRLWSLIGQTPWLDWLLLTKRPENISEMLPLAWLKEPQPNVWLGTSTENQEQADERIPHLLRVPAAVRFLSAEPLLGPVDLSPWLVFEGQYEKTEWSLANYGQSQPLHWCITGGESGHSARPMHPDWARSLRDQCQAAGVAFHFKQYGEYEPYEPDAQPPFWTDTKGNLYDGHGLSIIDPESGDVGKGWHEDSLHGDVAFRRVGKHNAGRLLDGRTWDEFPSSLITSS